MGNSFRDVLYEHREGEVPIKETVQKLMTDTVKVEDEKLLPHIYPPQWEYQLSSIFIDTDGPLVNDRCCSFWINSGSLNLLFDNQMSL